MSGGSYESEFERGHYLRGLHRYEDAIAAFASALGHSPNDPLSLAEIALCQSSLPGGDAQACETIREAVGFAPDIGYFHGIRTLILCRAGNPREALTSADSCIELDPGDSSGYAFRALALSQLDRWEEAEGDARNALEIDADNETAQNILCQTLYEQGRRTEAAEIADRQLARNPENAWAHHNWAYSELSEGRQNEAEEHFAEALRIDPDFESAKIGLLEAIRSRSPFYRGFLKAYFSLQLGGRFGGILKVPAALLGAAFHSVATLLMLRDARFRLALETEDKLLGVLGGGSFLLLAVCGILALLTLSPLLGKLCILFAFLGFFIAGHLSHELPDRLRM